MTDVRIVIDDAAVTALARDRQVESVLADVGRQIAGAARAAAPHRTGAGAASIGPQMLPGEVRVSWDRAHDYMRFPNFGTRYMTGKHFLDNAVNYAHL
jgi:HK97 gp10 family phage protein